MVLRVSAEVTDEGGETRIASRSFRLGTVAVEARVEMPGGFFRRGEPAELPYAERPGRHTTRRKGNVAARSSRAAGDAPPRGGARGGGRPRRRAEGLPDEGDAKSPGARPRRIRRERTLSRWKEGKESRPGARPRTTPAARRSRSSESSLRGPTGSSTRRRTPGEPRSRRRRKSSWPAARGARFPGRAPRRAALREGGRDRADPRGLGAHGPALFLDIYRAGRPRREETARVGAGRLAPRAASPARRTAADSASS